MIHSGHADKCPSPCVIPGDDIDKFNSAMEEQGMVKLKIYSIRCRSKRL